MRVRHKIPNVFSLSMMDVLCCALGCVIMLWLIGGKQSEDEADKLRDQMLVHAKAVENLEEAEKDRRFWKERYGDAEKDKARWKATSDEAEKDRRFWKERYGDAEKDKTAWKSKYDEAEKDKRFWKGRFGDAEKDKTAWKAKYDEAEKDKRFWKDRFGDAEKDKSDWKGKYDEAAKDKTFWKGKYDSAREDNERRFAGITLTGKRVVFLVDVSGSMVMIDSKTDAPKKWDEVCETVGRLMHSLQSLEQYQVICFSTKLYHPMGSEGKWLDFTREKTPDEVVKKLQEMKPDGGTDMHLGMKAAFDLRAKGLDTVYVLSDGLPSRGEGLTKEQQELDEAARGRILGPYVLKKLRDQWNVADRNKVRVKINTIGFFYESPDLGSFLWSLARENEGSFVGMSKP